MARCADCGATDAQVCLVPAHDGLQTERFWLCADVAGCIRRAATGRTADMGGANGAGKHYLIVANELPEDETGLEVEHPESCPRERVESGAFSYEVHSCDVETIILESGIDDYFRHRDVPKQPWDEYFSVERLAPGRYEIEAWFEHYPGGPWGPDEWSSGLCLVTVEKPADSGEGRNRDDR